VVRDGRVSRLDLFLVIAACGIGAFGVRLNLVPWTRAAAMREEVLSAVERASTSGCKEVWIRNVPDSVQGAYVFRNGLAEAIAPIAVSSAAPPQCLDQRAVSRVELTRYRSRSASPPIRCTGSRST
jgi:hypothetical protein